MPVQVWRYVDSVLNAAGHLDREHWVLLSALVLVVGLIALRGFGSRTNY
jgi:hypothetical protein